MPPRSLVAKASHDAPLTRLVKWAGVTCGLALLLLLVSCAAPKPTPDSFSNAEQAINVAVEAGAEQYAPVELRFAREKLEEAHKGVEFKQYDKTWYLIEQAEINAELALEKSRSAAIREKVTELARQNDILKEEFERNYGEKSQ